MMQRSAARILDANLNRAREAMRVLEDFARFALDDATASKTLKAMRHDLAAAAGTWPITELLAARDTPGDVGTRITTDGEKRRRSVADIVTAAAKRLTEALRVLEEYAKLEDAKTAAAIERIRYRAYDVEKHIVGVAHRYSGGGANVRGARANPPSFADVRLYVLITESLCRRPWLKTARDAIAGGADCLQLREKDLDDGELLSRARQLAELCHRHGVLCVINDRPDIARLAGADGVHLGQADMPVAAAREIAGPDLLIGKSTHNLAQFRRAIRERPDYLAIGPMYDTATKPQRHVPGPKVLPAVRRLAGASVGGRSRFPAPEGRQSVAQGVSPGSPASAARKPRRLDRCTAQTTTGRLPSGTPAPMPIVTIGGITADRLAPILAKGCRTVAVCAAIIGAKDPKQAAREIKRKLIASRGRPNRTRSASKRRTGTTD